MRYERFIIKGYSTVRPASDIGDGLKVVKNDISEVEKCENINQCKILESIFYTLVELFEAKDIEMNTTCEAHSFFIIKQDEGDIKHGFNSVWLSREKLKDASAMELSGAMIDLFLYRNNWSDKKTYERCHLFE